MKFQVVVDALPYLLAAAGTTLWISALGIALGLVIGTLVCLCRLSARPPLARAGAALCQLLPRRAAARAIAADLRLPAAGRPQRAGARRGRRRARPRLGRLCQRDLPRRAARAAARPGGGGALARLPRPGDLAAHPAAAGAAHRAAAAAQRVHPAAQGLVAHLGRRRRRAHARRDEHRVRHLSPARDLSRLRRALSDPQRRDRAARRRARAALVMAG